MSAADSAYAFAQNLIAEEKAARTGLLDLDRPKIHALETLPPEIAELDWLTTLDLTKTQVSDLAPIAQMMGMTKLDLSNTQVSELAPIAQMMGMTTLRFNKTQVSDLAPIAQMTGMTTLSLSNTQVSDFTPIAQMTGMIVLDLSITQISGLTPIAQMTGMTVLYLDNTQVSELTLIAQMTGMTTLDLNNTQISDLAPIAQMTGMTKLYLHNTQVSDMRPLRRLQELTDNPILSGLTFADTPATVLDPKLAELAAIEFTKDRSARTLSYLNSLNDADYDAFLTRRMAEEGIVYPNAESNASAPPSPTAKARAVLLAPRLAQARGVVMPLTDQITALLNQYRDEAGEIELPEILQLVERISAGFALTVQVNASSPDIAALETRLTEQEREITRLTIELNRANADLKSAENKTAAQAHEISELKATSFWRDAKKGAGQELGKSSVQTLKALTVLGAAYLLGESSTVVTELAKTIGSGK